jgi:hypothetical protein
MPIVSVVTPVLAVNAVHLVRCLVTVSKASIATTTATNVIHHSIVEIKRSGSICRKNISTPLLVTIQQPCISRLKIAILGRYLG